MRIVPVLDIKHGRAVHARGGDRSRYARLRSRLHPSSDPLESARAMRDRLGVNELYLADLDAIETQSRENFPVIKKIINDGFKVWLDRGIQALSDAEDPILDDLHRVIAGSETIQSLDTIERLVRRRGAETVVLSLDLDPHGVRLAPAFRSSEIGDSPLAIIEAAYRAGCRSLLVLDLASVGGENGFGRFEIVDEVRRRLADVSIAIGGGIRGIDDLASAERRGVSAALVGTAIHQGLIDREAVAFVASPGEHQRF
jgi:HisA/HisF family protein